MVEQQILRNKPMRFNVGDHTVRVSLFCTRGKRKFAAVIDRPDGDAVTVCGLPSYETLAAVCTQLCHNF